MSGELLESSETSGLDQGSPTSECYNALQIATAGYIQRDNDKFSSITIATFGYLCGLAKIDTAITDYCERATDRLAEEYKGKTRIEDILCAFTNTIQELEFVFQDLKANRSINTATGIQLDDIGEIVGLARQGLTDAQYQIAIKLQIVINTSNGEPESIIAYVKGLTNSTFVFYRPAYPAAYSLEINGTTLPPNIIKQVEIASPSGVAVDIVSTLGSTKVFRLAVESGYTALPNSAGFSEPTVIGSGGTLGERIT